MFEVLQRKNKKNMVTDIAKLCICLLIVILAKEKLFIFVNKNSEIGWNVTLKKFK